MSSFKISRSKFLGNPHKFRILLQDWLTRTPNLPCEFSTWDWTKTIRKCVKRTNPPRDAFRESEQSSSSQGGSVLVKPTWGYETAFRMVSFIWSSQRFQIESHRTPLPDKAIWKSTAGPTPRGNSISNCSNRDRLEVLITSFPLSFKRLFM